MITLIRSLCLSGAVFFCTHSLIAQQSDYTNSISQFKARYPKAEVVAVNFSEQYNFTLDKSKTETKVSANCSYQQNIVPLKDYISTADGLFYDDQSAIENVRASSAKNKSIKIPMQCADYESEGIFYSDAKVCMKSICVDTPHLLPVLLLIDMWNQVQRTFILPLSRRVSWRLFAKEIYLHLIFLHECQSLVIRQRSCSRH